MKKVLLFVLVLAAVGALAASLPFANFEGYETQLVLVNPTAEAISVALDGPHWPARVIKAESVLRREAFGGEGGGIEALSIPAGLHAYVEITEPGGSRTRIGDRGEPKRRALFLDLLAEDEGYRAFLFIHAAEGAVINLTREDGSVEQLYLKAGSTAIVPALGRRALVEALEDAPFTGFYGSGPVTAFALMSKQPSGELFAALPY